MGYISDVTLLCIVVVNIIIILASCLMDAGTEKHPKKKHMIAPIIMLSINLIFDIAVLAYFMLNAMSDNGKIFVLFIPLTGWILYENIKHAMESNHIS